MGERDLSAPPSAAPRALAPWLTLALLLAGLTALAALAGSGEERRSAVFDALLLAAAAVVAGRSLAPRLGGAAPLLAALAAFGSAAWALVWSPGIELLPLTIAVGAFGLAYGGAAPAGPPAEIYRPLESARRALPRWAAVGLLLAALLAVSPLYAGLVLPAALAVPAERRRAGLPALAAGWLAGLVAVAVVPGAGDWLAPTPLPDGPFVWSPALAGWNLVYLLVGRNIGLLAGFAPALLLATLGRRRGDRPALVAVCLALAAAWALALPFDFAAGWLNLSLLPLYGALWLAPARPPRRSEWLVTGLAAGLLLWPLWLLPGSGRIADGGVALTASWPRRLLPYETTLRRLPGRGSARLTTAAFEVRAVSGCRFLPDSGRFEVDGGGPAEIWLAASPEVDRVGLEFGPGAGSVLEVVGAEPGHTLFRPDGRVGFEVLLTRPRARHPLWLGEEPFAVYLISIRMPDAKGGEPLRFRLRPPAG